jgi:hypothetical protein
MPAKETLCFIAVCDDCGEDYENGEFTPHWPSSGEAVDDAVGSGEWWSKDEVLLCLDCKDKPHAFVPSELFAEDCDRCCHPADEHAEPVAAGGEAS